MFSGDPKPLDKSATVLGFAPDAACAWVVVYAAACPTCEDTEDPHDRLYLVPMIGWTEYEHEGKMEQRPTIMTSDGIVSDYLDLASSRYKFVAVLPEGESAIEIARVIYKKRFGEAMLDDDEDVVEWLPN